MKGHYGNYGGQFVPETLMHPLEELEAAYMDAQRDPSFQLEFDQLLRNYSGRPTPLYFAERLTARWGGAKIYLKREDLNHTGAHKINNCLGQGLLARRMRKKRIIAETGAGQHGVATATVCALLGLECDVYMGDEDIRRQELNVFRMKLLGARVIPVSAGSKTLKDAINESMRDWVTNVRTTDRKSTRLNSSHSQISYAVFCLKKKKQKAFSDCHIKLSAQRPLATCTRSGILIRLHAAIQAAQEQRLYRLPLQTRARAHMVHDV